ncbi:MAG: flagellar hook-basal body protein [Thermoguttaceae bacterium]
MPHGLYISADGAATQIQRLEVIANNLANVDTPGFKRDLAIIQSRYAEAMGQGTSSPRTAGSDDLGSVQFQETKTDFSPGPLKRTDGPTDLAIRGDGFFLVRKGDTNYLTRAGNFRLTSSGELVTQQGYPVLSDNRTPITITPDAGRWEITESGTLQQDGNTQNLGLVKPASLGDLVKVGENLFRPLAETPAVAPAERSVAPGYVELSGVQPTTELVNMLETTRLIEANVNMIKAQDEMHSALINRVLKA